MSLVPIITREYDTDADSHLRVYILLIVLYNRTVADIRINEFPT